MSTLKPGSPTSWQDCLTIQQSGSTNYCPGTGSCNSSPKQRQHNAPPEKIEPFTRGAKRMDTNGTSFRSILIRHREPIDSRSPLEARSKGVPPGLSERGRLKRL